MKQTLLLLSLLFTGFISFATTWLVGSSRTYIKPSQVSTLVQDGDTVLIDTGVYLSDVAHWTANNLVLQGTGGLAHLKANGSSSGGKAIWVIGGNNTIVDSIEFSLCTVQDQNGAGIRQEGVSLTVRHCYFHDNDEGILAGDKTTSDILIEYCEFRHNGFGDGYSHNLYINHVHSLTFQYNYSHAAIVGHDLKSRAYNNYILYNRIADEDSGSASYTIDLPNGGNAVIMGNEIEQGPLTQNPTMVTYGEEGLTNPTAHLLYMVNNTLINSKNSGTFIRVADNTVRCEVRNNIIAGTGTFISGTPTTLDTANNLISSIAGVGFVDAANADYHLLSTSPAVNGGTNAGETDDHYSLTAVNEYVHPKSKGNRADVGTIDIGAHEFGVGTNTGVVDIIPGDVLVYPNPCAGSFVVSLPSSMSGLAQLFDMNGRMIVSKSITTGGIQFSFNEDLSAGMYLLRVQNDNGVVMKRVVVE